MVIDIGIVSDRDIVCSISSSSICSSGDSRDSIVNVVSDVVTDIAVSSISNMVSNIGVSGTHDSGSRGDSISRNAT